MGEARHILEMFVGHDLEDVAEFSALVGDVIEMRNRQKRYFATRTSDALVWSKAAESAVDERLEPICKKRVLEEVLELPEIVKLIIRVREAQRHAWRVRLHDAYAKARELERELDAMLKPPVDASQGSLF